MHIVKLIAENIKKLRAVAITPTGQVVVISGRNAQGKTSILDAIWAALGGAKHIQAAPIRKGQNRARVKLDLGELIVERRFTEKGSVLSVESAEGARYGSPQTVLDALLGALAFDPLEFVHQEARAQFETLRGIVKLEVDVDKLDGLNRRDFDSRTQINRDAKALRAQAEGITVPADLPADRIDTEAALQGMTEAAQFNSDLETRKVRREQAAGGVVTKRQAVTAAREEAGRLRDAALAESERADRLEQEATDLERKLAEAPALPDPVDVKALRAEVEKAQGINRLIEQRDRQRALLADAMKFEEQAKELTETLVARDQAKADAIAKAPMPVEGLGFGDGVVLFGGIPFDQASTAEQLRVSLAIAMAANPKLRVILIKEWSLLDKEGQRLVADMAEHHDYQLWVEQVDDSGKMGFYIEDGQVVAVDGEPVTQQPEPEPETKPVPHMKGGPVIEPGTTKPRSSSPW